MCRQELFHDLEFFGDTQIVVMFIQSIERAGQTAAMTCPKVYTVVFIYRCFRPVYKQYTAGHRDRTRNKSADDWNA